MLPLRPVRHHLFQKSIEHSAVVRTLQVAQFVGYDVIDTLPRGSDQIGVEREYPPLGQAAPTLPHPPHLKPRRSKRKLFKIGPVPVKAFSEPLRCLFRIPAFQQTHDLVRCGVSVKHDVEMPADQFHGIQVPAADPETILFAEVEMRLASDITSSRSSRLELPKIVQLSLYPSGAPDNPLLDFGKIGPDRRFYHYLAVRMDRNFHGFPIGIEHIEGNRFFCVRDRAVGQAHLELLCLATCMVRSISSSIWSRLISTPFLPLTSS